MLNTMDMKVKGYAVITAMLMLSGCGAIPTEEEYALKQGRDVTNASGGTQIVATDSGLGNINRYGETAADCDRRRSTGSNIRTSSCSSVDNGSQPVRESSYHEQPPMIPPGLLNRQTN